MKNMPKEFKMDFPNTLIIIDGTELKTQTPCALGLQSQLYSCLMSVLPFSYSREKFSGCKKTKSALNLSCVIAV
jgi:hypothetical protein